MRTAWGSVLSTHDLIAHDSKSFYAFSCVGSTEELIVATSDLLDILKVQFKTGFFGWVCSSYPHLSRSFATMPPMCGGGFPFDLIYSFQDRFIPFFLDPYGLLPFRFDQE